MARFNTIQDWKNAQLKKVHRDSECQVNPEPEDVLKDFWMNHSYEYHQASKVRGKFISFCCALASVLTATAILAGVFTVLVWIFFRANFIFCFGAFYFFSLPFVILDQIFRRTYESVRMGFDRSTVLRQAFFGRSLFSGHVWGPWWRW